MEDDIGGQLREHWGMLIPFLTHLGLEVWSMTEWKSNPVMTDHFPYWPVAINQEKDHSLKDALGSQGKY